MATRCAICVVTGKSPEGPLMPHTVVYRGYSLCEEHLRMWEANREAKWEEITVVKVEMLDTDTVEEKIEKIEEAVEEEPIGESPDLYAPENYDHRHDDEPQVTMSEKKLSEFKVKRRRRKKTYFCTKCGKKHSRKSNIGKSHEEFKEVKE